MIRKINKCTGCTACMNICPKEAIKMKADKEGFLYPYIDKKKCIECGLCERSCPILRKNVSYSMNPIVYAVKNKRDSVRKVSASGGVFSAISDWILKEGGSVYGAIFEENFEVVHVRAQDDYVRDQMRGSKYVQSKLGPIFQKVKQDLERGQKVLFSGTPCQVDGLKHYLGKDYDTLYLCDIICHGVMSPYILRDFIKLLREKFHTMITSICFRDKKEDWMNQRWIYCLKGRRERVDDVYLLKLKKLYRDHLVIRPSCYECQYTNLNRISDITIGDYWGIDEAVPGFRDSLGVSCILIHTDKGKDLFKSILEELEVIQTPVKKCMQPQLMYPPEMSEKRDEFWEYYKKHSFGKALNRYARLSFKDGIKARIPIIIRKKLKKIIKS